MSELQNDRPTSLNEINYFRTTDRPGDLVLSSLNITEKEVKHLPKGSAILEVGSGIHQLTARYIKELNDGVEVISIDPTVNLSSDYQRFTVTNGENSNDIKNVQYIRPPTVDGRRLESEYADSTDQTLRIDDYRIDQAKKTGGVISALAPELPFADNSIKIVLDSYGPGMYLSTQRREVYLKNICRILSEDEGFATIFPIDNYRNVIDEIESVGSRNQEDINEWTEALEAITDYEITFEFFEKEQDYTVRVKDMETGDESEENNIRVGVRIIKHKRE